MSRPILLLKPPFQRVQNTRRYPRLNHLLALGYAAYFDRSAMFLLAQQDKYAILKGVPGTVLV